MRPSLRILCASSAAACLLARGVVAEPADVYIPAQRSTLPDGALSLIANPAGLALPAGAELRLQAAMGGGQLGDTAGMARTGNGWGAFASVPLGPLALGAALQHADTTWPTAHGWSISRASLGTAWAWSERLQFGIANHWSADLAGNLHPSWDAGVLARPWRWLSAAATAQGWGGGAHLERQRWGLGMAVRPWAGSERVTLGVDVQWPDDRPARQFAATLAVRLVDGVELVLDHRTVRGTTGEDQRTGLQLRLGFGQWGGDVALHGGPSRDGTESTGLAAGLRWSADRLRTWRDQGDAAVSLWLRGELSERTGHGGSHFGHLLLDLRTLRQEAATRVVVLRLQDMRADWAQVEELRHAILSLRALGKRVVVHADHLGVRGLALASSCDAVWLDPAGQVTAHGIGSDFVSLADALTQVGAGVEVVRFRAHKGAAEPLDHAEPSAELRATLAHAVTRRWNDFLQMVSDGRKLSSEAVVAAIAQGVAYGPDAQAVGLIDAVVEGEALASRLRGLGWIGSHDSVTPWHRPAWRRSAWGQQPRLAVVEVEGAIADHDNGVGWTGRSLGGSDLAADIDDLADDSRVAGVVVRIASGGGSVYGSEALRAAIARVADRKPVAASMGGTAASGGYWTALGARWMWANRATVTGSIGILLVRPEAGQLLQRLGVRRHHTGEGPHHDLDRLDSRWSDAERQLVSSQLGKFYGLFLERTAKRRGLTTEAVDGLGGGRLWFGDEALGRQLVDRQGGLLDAIDQVHHEAGLSGQDPHVVFLPAVPWQESLQRALGLPRLGAEAVVPLPLRRLAATWLDAAEVLSLQADQTPLALDAALHEPRGR